MKETAFYTEKDERCAAARLRRSIFLLCAVLLPLAAVYVAATLRGMRFAMLAALLAGFAWALFYCDIWLVPAMRYAAFLKQMHNGLRRSVDCELESLEANVQMQDGVRVHALHVRLCEGEDSRILYVNASHAAMLPAMGTQVRLTGYGRHVIACELL